MIFTKALEITEHSFARETRTFTHVHTCISFNYLSAQQILPPTHPTMIFRASVNYSDSLNLLRHLSRSRVKGYRMPRRNVLKRNALLYDIYKGSQTNREIKINAFRISDLNGNGKLPRYDVSTCGRRGRRDFASLREEREARIEITIGASRNKTRRSPVSEQWQHLKTAVRRETRATRY